MAAETLALLASARVISWMLPRRSAVGGGAEEPEERTLREVKPLLPTHGKSTVVASSYYSASDAHYLMQEVKFLKSLRLRPKRIIDASAHVGFVTRTLAHLYPRASVTAIELVPETHDALLENLRRAGLSERVKAVLGDSVEYLRDLPDDSADLVYFDPPWEFVPVKPAPADLVLGTGDNLRPLADVIRLTLPKSRYVLAKYPPYIDLTPVKRRVGARVVAGTRVTRPLGGAVKHLYTLVLFERC